MSHVLNIIDMPSKLLQDKEMDVSKAIHELSQAKLQLCNYGNNFPALMKEATDICKRWGVAACFSQKRTHESCLFQGPEDRFRIRVYNAVIDITTSQISNRFESFSRVVKKFDLLNPHKLLAMSEKELESACQNSIQIYSELQSSLYFEILQLKVSFEKDFKDKPAITIRDFVNLLYITYNSVASSFPNVLAAMFIFCHCQLQQLLQNDPLAS